MYFWLIRNGDKEGIERFDAILWKPPAGAAKEVIVEQDPKWQQDAMADLFMAQLAARGDKPRTSG